MAIPTPRSRGVGHLCHGLLCLVASLATSTAFALDIGNIVATNVRGEVSISAGGVTRPLKSGTALQLPATVNTGKDGSVDLKQGATTVSVGPDTQLDFPALETRQGAVDRIVQPRGKAFYDIGKRDGRKLRVETPYLVGVIKGTQFNVTAQPDGTTISLFEGRLEVLPSRGGESVDLTAGEIATLKAGDKSIEVLKSSGKLLPKPASMPPSNGAVRALEVGGSRRTIESELRDVVPEASDAMNLGGPVRFDTGSPNDPPRGEAPPPSVPPVDGGVDLGEPIDTVTPPVGGSPPIVDAPISPPVDVPVGEDLEIDDGNNGHGNDDDHDDSSNPGRGRGHGRP